MTREAAASARGAGHTAREDEGHAGPGGWSHAALLAAAGAALAAWTWGAWPDVMVDFGRELYVPWRIVEGDTLYRDLAWFNGPLSPHWNAGAFALFGVGLSTLVGVNLALVALATALLHGLLARAADRRSATVACLVFLVVFAFGHLIRTGNYNWVCPYSHETTHGLILGLGALASLQAWGGRGRGAWPGLAGALLGLAFLTQAAVFLADAAGAAVAFAAWLARVPEARARWPRHVGMLAAGFAAPVALAFGALATALPAGDALRALLGTWPAVLAGDVARLVYYERIAGFDRPGERAGEMLAWTLRHVVVLGVLAGAAWALRAPRFAGRAAAALAFAAGALAFAPVSVGVWLGALAPLPIFVLVAGASRVPLLRRPGATGDGAVAALGLAALGFVLLLRMGLHARAYHYGFTLAVPATLLSLVAALAWLPAWLAARGANARLFRAATLGIVAIAAVAHLQRSAGYVGPKTTVVGRGADAFRAAKRGDAVNEALALLRARPPGTLAVLPEGVMLNYLSRRRAPTRHLNFMPPELSIFGGEAAITAELAASPPDLALVAYKDLGEYGYRRFGDDYAPALHRWLLGGYETVATVGPSPLEPGRRFGFALLAPRPEAAQSAGATGSR
jgi:hypothetical protein